MEVEGGVYTGSSLDLPCAAHGPKCRRCETGWEDRPRLGVLFRFNTPRFLLTVPAGQC